MRVVTLPAIAILVGLFAAAGAVAQGYEGLIPDNTTSAVPGTSEDGNNDGGYAGLIAVPPSPRQRSTKTSEEPPGYTGLIPGAAPEEKPEPQIGSAGQSRIPYMPPPKAVTTSDDIRMQSALAAGRERHLRLQDKRLAARSDIDWKLMSPVGRDGMGRTERTAKSKVEAAMASVNDKTLSAEERRKRALTAYEDLLAYADGVRMKKSVPASLWKKMGAPDSYLQEAARENDNALRRIREALKSLKPLI